MPDVDHALLAFDVLDVEPERGAGRRERECELAEAELFDALQPQLDLFAHAADEPRFERLHESLVHGFERPQALLRDVARAAEIVQLGGRFLEYRHDARRGRGSAAAEERVNVALGELFRCHGAYWITNWGK